MVEATGLALVAGAFAVVPALPAAAAPDASAVVINEVYGGGGNSGANLNADYVELYNPTDEPITLQGLTLQYRSATGTSAANGVAALSGVVPAESTFLIQTSTAGANGVALPTADLTVAGVNMAAANGTVWLSTSAAAVDLPTASEGGLGARADVVDLVGFGTSNTYEGAAAAPAPSTTTSTARAAGGIDTDDNGADFAVGTQTPTPAEGDVDPGPDPDPETVAISDIQGTGDATPLPASPVITRGVVTAAYPTGGFNGFYLQTPGTGGEPKSAGQGSDALFVFLGAGADVPNISDHVEVLGTPGEFFGLTQLNATQGEVSLLSEPAEAVKARAFELPPTAAERERYEGELVAPSESYTVSNNYNLNNFAELGLAVGDRPQLNPTEVADPGNAAEIAQVQADNLARAVALDDGSTTNFLDNNVPANRAIPLPWITQEDSIRVNSSVDFTAPVIFDWRNSNWKFQPTTQLLADGEAPATFEDTRTDAPEDVGGDLQLATFNVLNYFATTGQDWVGAGPGRTCSYYNDRAGVPVTNNRCEPDGPRGAATAASLERQEAKIVAAINAIDAGITSLEEIENSAQFGAERDAALATLVEALNEDAGSEKWEYVPSPAQLPSDEDVIRTAFIYQPELVTTVGNSQILVDDPAFTNAREPLAQVFEAVEGGDPFTVIVNHFKSKGDSTPPATGDNANGLQGAFNGDRTRQATALAAFADEFAAEAGTDAVFLAGDFNSYTKEDPLAVLGDAGYANIADGDEWSYSFQGQSGSLDHVFANAAAAKLVTGSDLWEINAVEPIAYEYSRYNYNATDFYSPDPYRSSDHEPHVVGIAVADEDDDDDPDPPNPPKPPVPGPGSVAVGSTFQVSAPHRYGQTNAAKPFVVFYGGYDGKRVNGITYVTIRKVGTSQLIARAWEYKGWTTRMWTPNFTSNGSWQVSVTFVPSNPVYRPTTRSWWAWVTPTGR